MPDQFATREAFFAKIAAVTACAPMILLILAEMFADPQSGALRSLSRVFHLTAVLATCWAILTYTRFVGDILLVIAAAVIFKLLDSQEIFRFAYMVLICWLFAAAGYCAATFARRQIDTVILCLLLVSTTVALLQVLGVHEVFFLWSRHGYMDTGIAPVDLLPTFLRGVDDLTNLTLYQTRPSSIFPSNQLYTGFLLFAAAAVLMMTGSKARIGALLIGAGVALSSAKAALIGVPLTALICLIFMPRLRPQALTVIASTVGSAYLYSLLFPGLVSMAVSYNSLFRSILVRGLDLMAAAETAIGLKGSFTSAFVAQLDLTLHPDKFNPAESPNAAWATLGEINRSLSKGGGQSLSETTGLGWASRAEVVRSTDSVSMLSNAIRHPVQSTVVLVALAASAALLRRAATSTQPIKWEAPFLIALLFFALVANSTQQLLYWHWLGFGCGFVFARAFCAPADKNPIARRNEKIPPTHESQRGKSTLSA